MFDFRSKMRARLSVATFVLHVPVFLLLAGAAHKLGLRAPLALAVLGVACLLAPVRVVLGRAMNDVPQSLLFTRVFAPLYFVHWCSTVGMFVPAVLFGIGRFIWDAAHGVFEIPTFTLLACYLVALSLASWGVLVRRHWILLSEEEIAIAGLPRAFHGYRIAHLSDLHIGSLTAQSTIDEWVEKTNAAKPDLVVLTGDYVTNGTDFHAAIASALGRLRARDGVYASMGNHDYFGDGEPLLGLLQGEGVEVLRNRGAILRRDDSSMYLAGIDDTWTRRADLELALRERPSETTTVLLAHDPSTFDEAHGLDVDLVLSGHTHGGQVAVPFLARKISLSYLAHRFHLGIYKRGRSTLYVHPGLGTTGVPIRVGVAPTIAIHRLVAR